MIRPARAIPLTAALGLALAACAPAATGSPVTASLTDATGKTVGTASFVDTAAGARIALRVAGLAPGVHGTHVHANPACTDTTDAAGAVTKFGGAGGHFNPTNAPAHGGPHDAADQAHAGDLPNLTVDANGNGTLEFTTKRLTVASGPLSVVGRSVVIHASADDHKTQPIGGSGARVACGIITAS